ncbi:YwhD family protein [Effusibacillus pohliae]|uniref:YwhD family protein n=1 Tax=Effusibacillus pohliae TaxID=232270 RepID=UPI0003617185|nr:YwhD family protein [Effusibacillus pohliae]
MELSLTAKTGHDTPDEFASLSAVIIDGDSVFVDNGAIHGKSRVERGIQFGAKSPDQIPNGRRVCVVWVTLKKGETGMGYHGICAAIPFRIDVEAKLGYKSLPDQVNKMSDAMKGLIKLEVLEPEEKAKLGAFLKEFRGGELWNQSRPEVREAFGE